uniref:Acyl-ACP-thioesterase N-terminal domain-containing protein n=1 Tax=Nelumbo nucifera TaxID=4432 RepID=A0A822Y6T2_NELNU|nr:TPA_asm: hypothetical protein HUJ06_029688 [Nelumbo nucifera]
MILGGSETLDTRGINSKSASSGGLQVKVNAQAPPKINVTSVGLTSMECLKIEGDTPSSPPRTFIN